MTQVDQNSFAYNMVSSIASYLGVIPNPENIEQTIVEVKQRVDDTKTMLAILVKENEELKSLADELKKDVKRVTDANANIADLYKKACEEDSIAVDEGRKAAGILREVRTYIKATAERLGVSSKKRDDPKELVEKILDEVIKVTNVKSQLEKAMNRFDTATEPTVSQAAAAVAVKRPPFSQRLTIFLQYIGVLK